MYNTCHPSLLLGSLLAHPLVPSASCPDSWLFYHPFWALHGAAAHGATWSYDSGTNDNKEGNFLVFFFFFFFFSLVTFTVVYKLSHKRQENHLEPFHGSPKIN